MVKLGSKSRYIDRRHSPIVTNHHICSMLEQPGHCLVTSLNDGPKKRGSTSRVSRVQISSICNKSFRVNLPTDFPKNCNMQRRDSIGCRLIDVCTTPYKRGEQISEVIQNGVREKRLRLITGFFYNVGSVYVRELTQDTIPKLIAHFWRVLTESPQQLWLRLKLTTKIQESNKCLIAVFAFRVTLETPAE
jgi:hypothetical protein